MIYKLSTLAGNIYSPNYSPDRAGKPVTGIVIHKSEGDLASMKSWFGSTASQVSAHYAIDYDGSIYCFVDPKNTAWHCGHVDAPTWSRLQPGINPNLYTIGIELVGFAANPVTLAQYKSLCNLTTDLLIYYQLDPVADSLPFHHEITSYKACPGYKLSKWGLVAVDKLLITYSKLLG